ncbi:hypothetical protein BDBG_16536 [Blastomyces gilchristii SLH14081]|uniref:Uncharacterized protein n=1 Tax=Blastomyces gilchristii (strain SLH14081) TaxID=559298 RepID=A0A179UDS1_BLAGS|nr:uncharacterized protein BDBG_16536 [Blastomyces gilchristii SLH14081]OAT05990.1 hypothetical protein BDBG_16536 [Blastomyces gilchristii SLH14081]
MKHEEEKRTIIKVSQHAFIGAAVEVTVLLLHDIMLVGFLGDFSFFKIL